MLKSYSSIGYPTARNMHKPTDSPLSIRYNAARPIPAAGRASGPNFIISSYASQAQLSALALFGAHKNSPQRSAGSFNIVHPKRKALISTEHRSASDVTVKNDENEVQMGGGKPSWDTVVGACPPFSPPSSSFINAYSWEDQPFPPVIPTMKGSILSRSSDHIDLFKPGHVISKDSAVRCISSAEAYTSEASYSGSISKQAPPKPGEILLNKERLDIPIETHEFSGDMHHHVSYKGSANMVCEGVAVRREYLDLLGSAEQETEHESLTMSDKEESQPHTALSSPPKMQIFSHSGSIMGESSCISNFSSAASKPSHGDNMKGKPSLKRSCSLLSISPTSFYEVVEESNPLITASSHSSKRGSLAEGRKRSFSAIELSSAELSSCQGIKPHKMQPRTKPHGSKATDPKSFIAAKARRVKLSKKIRMLQSLVPNGERLDTVSMLGQTLEYIRFLQYQLGELHDQAPGDDTNLPSSNFDKWKAFMETPTTTLGSTSSTLTTS